MAGLDRHNADPFRAESVHHPVVPEVIGCQHPLESKALTHPVGGQCRLDTRWQVRAVSDRGHANVIGHNERDPRIDGVPEC